MAVASVVPSSPLSAPPRGSAIAVASGGLRTASGRADADASTLATSGPDVSAIVDLDVQRDTFDALATVVHANDEMLGSVLDILAWS